MPNLSKKQLSVNDTTMDVVFQTEKGNIEMSLDIPPTENKLPMGQTQESYRKTTTLEKSGQESDFFFDNHELLILKFSVDKTKKKYDFCYFNHVGYDNYVALSKGYGVVVCSLSVC